MPAFFAHYQFGEQVLNKLDGDIKKILVENKKEFRIGLQGPDVFFFYKPWQKENDVVEYGHHLHDTPAVWMFQRALGNGRYSDAYAYMMGVVCHFALDSTCHPYVSEFEKSIGVSHMEIESEFEKMLLRKAGKDPFTYRVDQLIPTDEYISQTLYEFYHVYSAKKFHFALRWMQNFKQLFTEKSRVRLGLMNTVLTVAGFGKFKDQILQHKDNPLCEESNEKLYQLSLEAINLAVELIKELDDVKQTGEPLSDKWYRNFV